MSELRGIYTLWLREVKKFVRERSRLVNAFVQPLLWLFIFGTGMRFSATVPGVNYQQFIFPGLVCQAMLFTAMFLGISVIWDREFGFLKEILVSPISRSSPFRAAEFCRPTNCFAMQRSLALMTQLASRLILKTLI